jgi:hypothetical protein
MSLNAIATPAAREPGRLVTRWRSLTVAKVDSIHARRERVQTVKLVNRLVVVGLVMFSAGYVPMSSYTIHLNRE